MTPTLKGRWQSRIFLLLTIGLIITFFFSLIYGSTVYIVLIWVILFGLIWDVIYNYAQTFRWDHDWPPTLQLAAGIIEAIFLWIVMQVAGDFIGIGNPPSGGAFFWHYTTVWVFTFLASQSLMRLIFPRWRYTGGEWM